MLIATLNNSTSLKQMFSPKRFLEVLKKNEKSIKSSRFVAPVLGKSAGFGKVEVTFKYGARK